MLKRSLVAILSIGAFVMANAVDHVEEVDIDSVASFTDVDEMRAALKGYLESIIDFALENEEAGDWLRQFILDKAEILKKT